MFGYLFNKKKRAKFDFNWDVEHIEKSLNAALRRFQRADGYVSGTAGYGGRSMRSS